MVVAANTGFRRIQQVRSDSGCERLAQRIPEDALVKGLVPQAPDARIPELGFRGFRGTLGT